MRRSRKSSIGLVALFALVLTFTSCSKGERDEKAGSSEQSTSLTVGKDAANFCNDLLTDEVKAMTDALPDMGAGLTSTDQTEAVVLAGASALRDAKTALPDDVATVAMNTADAIDAYVKEPSKKKRIDAVLTALDDLSTVSSKECDL